MLKKIMFGIFLLIMVSACSGGDTQNGVQNLEAAEFRELIQEQDVFVVDVHIPEQQHIEGTDAVIPYNDLASYEDQLPRDKSTPIAIYCRSGSMSAEASQELKAMGYKNVYNLLGGANAWRTEGYAFA